jgi:hypothetical protein
VEADANSVLNFQADGIVHQSRWFNFASADGKSCAAQKPMCGPANYRNGWLSLAKIEKCTIRAPRSVSNGVFNLASRHGVSDE